MTLRSQFSSRRPLVALLLIVAVLSSACGNPGSELIGQWSSFEEFDYGTSTYEFLGDGSGTAKSESSQLPISWLPQEDGRIKLSLSLGGLGKAVVFITVTGDEFMLKGTGSETRSYVRDGSPRAEEIQATIQKAVDERTAAREEKGRAKKAAKLAAREKREASRLGNKEAGQKLLAAGNSIRRGNFEQGIAEYERAAALFEEFGNVRKQGVALNDMAWYLATYKDPSKRDGARAVAAALRATELRPEDKNFWGTLAAAYARDGQFEQAVTTMEWAITVGRIRGGEKRLAMYREGRAYPDD